MRRLAIVALFYSVLGHAHLSSLSNSGIPAPKYSDILKLTEKWQNDHPELVEVIDYGKSVKGKPLRMVVVGKKGATFAKRPALFMSGATHGNEYLNIEDRLPTEILKATQSAGPISRFIEGGGVYVFVPILNPDGFEDKIRENANGVDLNRDWDVKSAGFSGFKQVETSLLANSVESLAATRNLKWQVTVDYHCCIGALLHPWSYEGAPPLNSSENEKHQAVGELVTKNLQVDYGTTGEILGYYPMGTTKDYYFEKYKAAAFTFEGRYMKEATYLDRHFKWWQEITSLVMGDPEMPSLPLASRKKKLFFLAD